MTAYYYVEKVKMALLLCYRPEKMETKSRNVQEKKEKGTVTETTNACNLSRSRGRSSNIKLRRTGKRRVKGPLIRRTVCA